MEGFFVKKLYGKKSSVSSLKFVSRLLIILVACLLVSLLNGKVAEATYQSRPGFTALVNTTTPDFFKEMRKMETSTGPMGLNATLDDSYNDTSGNGIDVHMIKNSEWGAVAMLAMSGYGGGAADSIDTYTTGSTNYTGVYGMGNGNWEYTMTFVTLDGTTPTTTSINSTVSTHQNTLLNLGINSKYYDLYQVTTSLASTDNETFYKYNYSAAGSTGLNHKGDAIYEMYQILLSQKGQSAYTRNVTLGNPFFVRGSSGGGGVLASSYGNGDAVSSGTSRAVVVCGSGL